MFVSRNEKPAHNSHRRVLSGDGGRVRVVVGSSITSTPSLFQEFFEPTFNTGTTFVDKTLAIEAFLRDGLQHHLILRPRQSGKTYTLSMVQQFLERPQSQPLASKDITKSTFRGTLIAEDPCRNLVANHFHQYPVLYIDLKDVKGATYQAMLDSFDRLVADQLDARCDLLDGPLEYAYIQHTERYRNRVFQILSEQLQIAYGEDVVVLIDEYDSPMHVAIENGYADSATSFFAEVFERLLKSNPAVCASMIMGICRTSQSGWMSGQLNNLHVFPLHAEDDRYARFFLFTEEEVELLRNAHESELSIDMLRDCYKSYKARGVPGSVNLFNPFSIVRAIENNRISDWWVETGRHSPFVQQLWRTSEKFRSDFNRLMTQDSITLNMDDHTDFKTWDTISDSGLWGLLYSTGYLAVDEFDVTGPSLSGCTFRIPHGEISSQWHSWLRAHLWQFVGFSMSGIITDGNVGKFQASFTAFLQKHLSLFFAPRHWEKVYQALCFILIFSLSGTGDRYEVKMEQDGGYGRTVITAHPRTPGSLLSLVFKIKQVATHSMVDGKRTLKSTDRLKKELSFATDDALGQIELRQYRARVPLDTRTIHEYGIAFAGKICVAAVRTLERTACDAEWVEVDRSTAVIPDRISEADFSGYESDGDDMDVDERM